jgi:hypothetical protein
MRSITLLTVLAAGSLLSGCETLKTQPEPTSLQIQAYQVKEFETDKTNAFASVMNVFQDLGYIIQSADKETGFITAVSPTKGGGNLLELLAGVSITTSTTKATAFIEEIRPAYTTVRLNFVVTEHTSGEKGANYEAGQAIQDPKPYQVAFNKIDDALFIRAGTRANARSPVPPLEPTAAK